MDFVKISKYIHPVCALAVRKEKCRNIAFVDDSRPHWRGRCSQDGNWQGSRQRMDLNNGIGTSNHHILGTSNFGVSGTKNSNFGVGRVLIVRGVRRGRFIVHSVRWSPSGLGVGGIGWSNDSGRVGGW